MESASLHLGQILPFETLKRVSRLSGSYLMAENDRVHISLLFMCIGFSHILASYFFSRKPTPQSRSCQTSGCPGSFEGWSHFFTCLPMWTNGLYLKINIDAARPVVLMPGNSTSPYSLYPFTPQQQLSWEISSLSSFRLRRIAHWLDSVHPTNPSVNGGLYGSFGSSEL